jgi:mannose-binding lectin 1
MGQRNQQETQRTQQQQQQQQNSQPAIGDIPQMLSDVLAGNIKSQSDQFADLHNRIQIINHRVNAIYDILERFDRENQDRFNDLMHRVVPIDDRTRSMLGTVNNAERTGLEVQRRLESQDMKDMLNAVHNAIQDNHNALSASMPLAMAHSKFDHFLSREIRH